jgi:hypothetical protein
MMLESVHTPLRQSNSEDTRFTSPLLTPNEPRWGCRPRTEASQKASGAHGDVHTSKGLNLAIDLDDSIHSHDPRTTGRPYSCLSSDKVSSDH